jgi:hypothetical protein
MITPPLSCPLILVMSRPRRLDSPRSSSPDARANSEASKVWIDPSSLPDESDGSGIAGNVSQSIKRLTNNTYFSYGVGSEDCFAHHVGKRVKFIEVSVYQEPESLQRWGATTVAEVTVSKSRSYVSHFSARRVTISSFRYVERCWDVTRRMRRLFG